MRKKLMMTCMAITAFAAFVTAPAASASPVLTEFGTIAVGSSIELKNIGVAKFTGGFGVECEVVYLQGTVTKNSGTEIAAEFPVGSAKFTNFEGFACSSALGATTVNVTSKICLATIPKTDNITMDGCLGAEGTTTPPVTFDLTVGGITCKYSVATLRGTFTTNSSPGQVGLSGAAATEEEPRSFFCPDTGSFDMSLGIYTKGRITAASIS